MGTVTRGVRGSCIAARVARGLRLEFADRQIGSHPRTAARETRDRLPRLLKARWDAEVEADLLVHPIDHDPEHTLRTTDSSGFASVSAHPTWPTGARAARS